MPVRTPVVPVMVPPVSWTSPTVSANVATSSVPPVATVTKPVSSSVLFAPKRTVPAVMVVPPT